MARRLEHPEMLIFEQAARFYGASPSTSGHILRVLIAGVSCRVSGGVTHAKSATKAAKFWRRLWTTILPELQQAHLPDDTLARLQCSLPPVRATGIHLPGLRPAD